MQRLSNKVAIITGGASGIGKTTALLFAKEGAKVVIWDFNEAKAQETIEEAKKENLALEFYKADVTQYEEINALANIVKEKHGKIDILINNAGITADSTLKKMTPEQWQKVIDVNLTGVFNCGKAVSLLMAEQGSGAIINTSSVVGIYGNFGQSNYVATKAGLIGMSKVWSKELGKNNIRVNAVAPGFIATEMITTVPEKVIDGLKAKTPLGRLGLPEEIAEAYLFLASDNAKFISGTVLSVDGGLSL
ncbi:MAG: 3-oxoacyl-ACP reductase FabG [Luteibaculaceae bacterium]